MSILSGRSNRPPASTVNPYPRNFLPPGSLSAGLALTPFRESRYCLLMEALLAAGPSAHTPISSTSTQSTEAATSPPGRSRNCSQPPGRVLQLGGQWLLDLVHYAARSGADVAIVGLTAHSSGEEIGSNRVAVDDQRRSVACEIGRELAVGKVASRQRRAAARPAPTALTEDVAVDRRTKVDADKGTVVGRISVTGPRMICRFWMVRSSRVSTVDVRAFLPVANGSLRARSAKASTSMSIDVNRS